MAPEQFSSTAANHRADIFASGAVIYELLTLKKAFPAEDYWALSVTSHVSL